MTQRSPTLVFGKWRLSIHYGDNYWSKGIYHTHSKYRGPKGRLYWIPTSRGRWRGKGKLSCTVCGANVPIDIIAISDTI